MAQYIDKDTLVAEIERRTDELWDLLPDGEKVFSDEHTKEDAFNLGKYTALESLDKFIDTLEMKEVDLEKELDYCDYIKFFNVHPNYNNVDWGFEETWTFAQYCYKLGLKAQKGE